MAFTKITHAGIGSTGTVLLENLEVTGVGTFGGSVSVGGTLTYEDVTNIDSVGLITARAGVVVGSGITLSKDGDVFFTGIATGNGSGLTALNATNIASGTVPTARLGSGTASSSTFLRGDSTFAAVTSTTINSNTNNQVITATGTADTLQGESNLTFDGTSLDLPTVNSFIKGGGHNIVQVDATKTYLYGGTGGVQFRTADNSAELINITNDGKLLIGSATEGHADADELTLAGTRTGLTIRSASDNYGNIFFSDATSGADEYVGSVQYYHADNSLRFKTSSTDRLLIDSTGRMTQNGTTSIDTGSALTLLNGYASSDHTILEIISDPNQLSMIYMGASDDRYQGQIRYKDNDHYMSFWTDQAERIRILSGGGITFNGDTATANALNDYEEGSWTVNDLGGSAYNVASGAVGKYVKVGAVVHAWAQFGTDSSGNVSVGDRILIGDLPFNANGINNPRVNVSINYSSGQYSTVGVSHVTSSNEIAFTVTQTTGHARSGAGYYVQVTYFTDS